MQILKFIVAILACSSLCGLHAYADTDIENGDSIPNGFDFPNGCAVNVFDGGTIGLSVDLSNGELNIFGGEIAVGANGIATGFTNSNNTVRIHGGTIGPFFQFFNSTGFVDGGTLNTFGVFSGSEVTISGGMVTGFPDVFSNGVVNIRGGTVNSFRALAGSTINIEGTEFTLDSVPLNVLPNQQIEVLERDVTLSVVLSDGSPFEIFLRSFDPGFPAAPVALPSSTINLISTLVLGDVNLDGSVDLLDVTPFVEVLASGSFSVAADINGDGAVNLIDVDPFVDLLSN